MTKNEEYKGFWFLPSNVDNKVPGILYFRANTEIRLELIGGFETKIPDILTSKSIDIIQGITHENEEISLFFCNRYGSWNMSSPYPITNYNCQYLIRGKHLNEISEKVFNRIEADLAGLFEWYPSGRIQNEIVFSEDDKPTKINCTISDSDYWEKIVDIDNDLNAKIRGTANYTLSPDHRETNFSQNTLFEICRTNSKESFVYFLNKVELFRQFLSLASLSTSDYLQLTLFDDDDYQLSQKGNKLYNRVLLYFVREKEDNHKIKRHEFLFSHRDIIDTYPVIIRTWYGFNKDLAPIRKHLIESIKFKKVFTSLDFLIIAQALEGYHRRFVDKKNDKIFLKERIEGLLGLFLDVQKVSNYPINITHVVNSRHYYSHFYEKNDNVLDGLELFKLTEQLRVLLICCVLRLIGFDTKLINKLINNIN